MSGLEQKSVLGRGFVVAAVLGAIPSSALGLLLHLHSGIPPGIAQETISGTWGKNPGQPDASVRR